MGGVGAGTDHDGGREGEVPAGLGDGLVGHALRAAGEDADHLYVLGFASRSGVTIRGLHGCSHLSHPIHLDDSRRTDLVSLVVSEPGQHATARVRVHDDDCRRRGLGRAPRGSSVMALLLPLPALLRPLPAAPKGQDEEGREGGQRDDRGEQQRGGCMRGRVAAGKCAHGCGMRGVGWKEARICLPPVVPPCACPSKEKKRRIGELHKWE